MVAGLLKGKKKQLCFPLEAAFGNLSIIIYVSINHTVKVLTHPKIPYRVFKRKGLEGTSPKQTLMEDRHTTLKPQNHILNSLDTIYEIYVTHFDK